VYDIIECQFETIHNFFRRVNVLLQIRNIPDELLDLIVQILVKILRIFGVATQYAKANRFKRRYSYEVCNNF
jgi:hypothetical protein